MSLENDLFSPTDFTASITSFQISDSAVFEAYLSEIYTDLSYRSKNRENGIEKLTLFKYFNLPLAITDRLFNVMDADQNGFLSKSNFIEGMKSIFLRGNSLESLISFIFKIYDFDLDGYISKDDVKLILNYLPVPGIFSKDGTLDYKGKSKENFTVRRQLQAEIDELLAEIFEGEETEINLEEFAVITKEINSDFFFFLYVFLLQKRPFSVDTLEMFKNRKRKTLSNEIKDRNNVWIGCMMLGVGI